LKRGSILIIVLWSLFILSALALAISGYVRAEMSVAGKLSLDARTYYLARAGAERGIAEVRNAPAKEYDAPGDGWGNNDASFKDVQLGGGAYSVTGLSAAVKDAAAVKYGLSDEERKINVNTAPINILQNFFEIAGGLGAEEAKSVAASIVNWRGPADKALKEGAGAFYYQTLDRPYKCKNAALEVPEELLLIKGITTNLFDKIRDRVTIFGNGAVNINTADETVLRSIGMSEELAGKIARFREENVFDDASKIAALLKEKESISDAETGKINSLIAASLLSVKSDNFGGVADGKIGAASSKIAFIFDRKDNVIRYWRE